MDAGLESLELKISKFLRAGVLVAGTLLATGWIANLFGGRGGLTALATYRAVPLREDLADAIARGEYARLISYVGLAVLIALPFTRVVLTAVLFWRRREWVLAGIATFVAAALVASIALGIDL